MGEARRKRLAAELEQKVRTQFEAAVPGFQQAGKIFCNVYDLHDALVSERIGRGAVDFLTLAYLSAQTGGTRECFGCQTKWSADFSPTSVLLVEFLGGSKPENALLAGLCGDCADEKKIKAGLTRDFGITPQSFVHVHGAGTG